MHPVIFRVLLAASWGLGMWQFYESRDHVQSGLRNSMEFIYADADKVRKGSTLWSWLVKNE